VPGLPPIYQVGLLTPQIYAVVTDMVSAACGVW